MRAENAFSRANADVAVLASGSQASERAIAQIKGELIRAGLPIRRDR